MEVSMGLKSQVRSLLPLAATPRQTAARRPRGRHTLEVAKGGGRLRLVVAGQVEAMDLVEQLTREVSRCSRARSLELDFGRAAAFDNLALSAVLVVLRNQAANLSAVSLRGLAPWAQRRIRQTGAENLMGRQWTLRQDEGRLELLLSEPEAGGE